MNRPTAICGTEVIECPKCTLRFMFYRSRTPLIDSCGFESYSLACKECGVALAGIVDPCDDTLLLSELATEVQGSGVSLQHGTSLSRRARARSVG